MRDLKLKQLEYESNTWKRLLIFMMDENIHLKNRLVEILKYISDNNLLEEMENFQTRFIKKDELISFLRDDVAELDTLRVREIFEHGEFAKEIDRKLNKLRNNIINAEAEFSKLKIEFNNYLAFILNTSDWQKYLSNNAA